MDYTARMPPVTELDDWSRWSRIRTSFAERPLYADALWGRYKADQGWNPRGLALFDGDGHALAAALVQRRRLSPLGPEVHLIQGGPVVAPGIDAKSALAALLGDCGGWPAAHLVYPAQATTPELEQALAALGFAEIPMNGTGTVLLDLSRTEPELRAALSKNWRHNLSRAEKRGLEVVWIDPDERPAAAQRMAALYDALVQRKNFAGALDAVRLTAVAGADPALEWLEVRKDGILLASRIGWMGGDTALDLLAASSDEAKTTYANYMALWALIDRSRQRGARRFDCGGIDPLGNVGVYNFKKGLSGEEAVLGRLWLRTRPGFLWPLVARRLAGTP